MSRAPRRKATESFATVGDMPTFDPNRVKELFDVDAYAAGLGIDLVSVTDDELTVALTVDDGHLNFLGGGHGGMVFSLADCAFSLASNSAGPRAVAIDTHMVFTAAASSGDRLTAVATELNRGRTLASYHVKVTRQDGRVAAIFTGTVHISVEN